MLIIFYNPRYQISSISINHFILTLRLLFTSHNLHLQIQFCIMFVSPTVAQALAFASKVAISMVIPQIAAFLTIFSPRKALQLTFFSSITNCITSLLDTRIWQHTRYTPKFPIRVSGLSWLTIFLSLTLWLLILGSDVFLFQLSKRHIKWIEYSTSDISFNFTVASFPMNPTFNISAPLALVEQTEGMKVFGNNTYIPSVNYEYSNYIPTQTTIYTSDNQTYQNIYDNPEIYASDPNVTNTSLIFKCRCGQEFRKSQVSNGVPQSIVDCKNGDTPNTYPYYPSIGFYQSTNVLAYQGYKGAYFNFMTSKQRDSQIIEEISTYPNTTRSHLEQSVKNYTLVSLQLNGTSANLSLDLAFEFLSKWQTLDSDLSITLIYYKIDYDEAYGIVPRYTYDYLLFEIVGTKKLVPQAQTNDYKMTALILFNYISYSVQNVFVPKRKINPQYLGIDELKAFGPRSTLIRTSQSPEHVMIAMLKDLPRPILVKSIETIDAMPALISIGIAAGISLVLLSIRFMYHIFSSTTIPFDPYLELFHCAVDDQSHRTMDNLLVKLQDTDLIMVHGYCPDIDGNKIGLVSRKIIILPFASDKKYK